MENLHFTNTGPAEINKLMALEQDQLALSIGEKLSALIQRFQLILRAKPAQIKNLLRVYHRFLAFKEDLAGHFEQEQVVLRVIAEQVQEAESPEGTSNRLLSPEQPVKHLKNQLTTLINTLNVIRQDFNQLGYSFPEFENLSLFLSVHKNLIKYVLRQRLNQEGTGYNFQEAAI